MGWSVCDCGISLTHSCDNMEYTQLPFTGHQHPEAVSIQRERSGSVVEETEGLRGSSFTSVTANCDFLYLLASLILEHYAREC